MSQNIWRFVNQFCVSDGIYSVKEYGSGNINSTFIVTTVSGKKYILQKINTEVFSKPYVLMQNIDSVTRYCRKVILENGGCPERETLTIVKTRDGKNLLKVDGEYWRMYNFVSDSLVFDKLESAEMFGSAGKAFGRFAKLLDGYSIEELDETIPNFHNSKLRFRDFLRDVRRDSCGRVDKVTYEIQEITKRFKDLVQIVDLMEIGEIPARVTHNDTKISNVLFDQRTGDALCVIDLDTVMPGSILFDFGDAIRSGASTETEDGDDPKIDLDYFREFTSNYLRETYNMLFPMELEYLVFSCRVITLELAMRFLNDYINGDTYFRPKYEGQNLKRARNQLCLLRDMEKNYDKMCSMVKNIVEDLSSGEGKK